MVSRKRTLREMEDEPPAQEPSTLDKLRNMWEFAALMQYIFLFGRVVKIDEDFDIEDLETECQLPMHSEKLSDIGLALLKFVSSHKGLTPEIFDEYTRRQYVAKAPQRNPFGTDDEPKKFAEFDIFTKIRVLQQLSTWTLHNPDRIREKMSERDSDQSQWRMEPLGWDSEDRSYFVFDDDRLYRRTDAPLPAPPTKSKPKAKRRRGRATRGNKRRKISDNDSEAGEEGEDEETKIDVQPEEDDGFGGMKWECIAITLEEYEQVIQSIHRSKDPNEKELHKRLVQDVLPVIQGKADEQKRKAAKRQKELENLQKLATAKRSSRIADKMEKRKETELAVEAERKRQADLSMAKKEVEKQRKIEEARQSRMMTREQRLKEREVKRILHEEELARLEEESKKLTENQSRISERHLKTQMIKNREELEKLAQEEEHWIFDCSVCGVHGENIDDGTHSIACDKCNVWQHSACHGILKEQAERDDFHFICADCKHKMEEANKPKLPPLKLRLGASASPKSNESSTEISSNPGIRQTPPKLSFTNGAPRPVEPVTAPNNPVVTASAPQPNVQPLRAYEFSQNYAPQPVSPSKNPSQPFSFSRPPYTHGPMNTAQPGFMPTLPPMGTFRPHPVQFGHNEANTLPNPRNISTANGHQAPRTPMASFPGMNGGIQASPSSRHNHLNSSPRAIHSSPVKTPNSSFITPNSSFNTPNNNHQGRPHPGSPFLPNGSPKTALTPKTAPGPAHSPTKLASSPPLPPIRPLNILPAPSSPGKHESNTLQPLNHSAYDPTRVLPPVTALNPSSSPQILTPPRKRDVPEHQFHPGNLNGML